jgi:hypothetical protein
MNSLRNALTPLAVAALVAACDGGAGPTQLAPTGADPAQSWRFSEWSEPVLLDGAVNSPHRELSPTLSPDGLSLYFNSDRPGAGPGLVNIWVARRACEACPWQAAQPLPAPVNGPGIHGTAVLSRAGHLLFWSSNRPGSEPAADGSEVSQDIWMVHRPDPRDDFGWADPVRIVSAPGCQGEGRVNTERDEFLGSHVVAETRGYATLYFGRDNAPPLQVRIDRHGQALGCAEAIAELGAASPPSVRADGKELVFTAAAGPDGIGGPDLWVSTRPNPTAPWSTPVNLGEPVNSPFADLIGAGLSHDGTTLLWASAAARGGLGRQDIWMSTRAPGAAK